MKNSFSVLIILALALAVSQAFFLRSPKLSKEQYSFAVHSEEPQLQFNQVQKWFDSQVLDHFNPQDSRVFSQRYWVVSDYYKQGGPVFLYICGEYTCPGVNQERLYPVQLAQKFNALFVVLEHRFYGLSQPFGDLKTTSLAYLTVEQALEDLAYFIQWFKVQGGYGLTDNKWITIGGSYPGALSAWFRYKYPHLTVGAWASSAVVDAILDFPDFDYQIFVSTNRSSPQCPQIIQNLTAYYESQLYDASPDVQKKFQAQFGDNALKLSREELLWFIADMFVETVQYGSRRSLCANLTSYSSNWDQLLSYSISFLNTGDPRGYGSYFLKNDTFDPETMDLGRQWMWQVCSQFGWLQTPATNSQYAMRSKRVNLDFYRQYCQDIFGIPIWPNPDLVNLELGGVNLQATNLVMFNGVEDPWKWASKLNSTSEIQSIEIDCPDCAHCVELYTPKADDANVLKIARAAIYVAITRWLRA